MIIYLYILSLGIREPLIMLLFSFCFCRNIKRKDHFVIRFVISFLLLLLFSILINFLGFEILLKYDFGEQVTVIYQLIFMVIMHALYYLIFTFIFQENKINLLYFITLVITAFSFFSALEGTYDSIFGCSSFISNILDGFSFVSLIGHIFSLLVSFIFSYFLLSKKSQNFDVRSYHNLSQYVIALFFVNEISQILVSSNLQARINIDASIRIFANLFILIICIIVFFISFIILFWMKDANEKENVQNYYDSYRHQQELMKRNVELINIKCHDLKHIIRKEMEGYPIDDGFKNEVEKMISIYDSSVATGNAEIDTILTQKSLECNIEKIPVVTMIDAKELSFLSSSDIASLFGNAFDNAIEAERKEEKEKRFIRVFTIKKANRIHLYFENYCSQNIKFDNNGYPITSKEDFTNHGFGVRSMKMIVEKYKGVLTYLLKDNTFVLSILFFCNTK